MIPMLEYWTWRTIYLKLLLRTSRISFPNIMQKLGFIPCKAEQPPKGMELQQKQDDDEKHLGKLFRNTEAATIGVL